MAGAIKNFTGVDARYEPPENPELHRKAGERGADVLALEVVEELVRRGIV